MNDLKYLFLHPELKKHRWILVILLSNSVSFISHTSIIDNSPKWCAMWSRSSDSPIMKSECCCWWCSRSMWCWCISLSLMSSSWAATAPIPPSVSQVADAAVAAAATISHEHISGILCFRCNFITLRRRRCCCWANVAASAVSGNILILIFICLCVFGTWPSLFIRTCFVCFVCLSHCLSFSLSFSLSLSLLDFSLGGFCLCFVNCLFCELNSLWRMWRALWRCLLPDFYFQLRLLNIYAQQFVQPLAEWRNKFSIA